MKEGIKSVVVLTAICLVTAVLLAVTNYYTAPVIEANKAAAATGSLSVVMPDSQGFEEVEIPADSPATIKAIYRETSGMGYVVLLSTTSQYSSGDMEITVGFGADNKISGISLTSYFESKDFGKDTYPQTYVGQDSALGGVDTVAGVTYSSMALKNAVTDAFNVLINGGLLAEGQKSEEQLIAEVMPLALPGCANTLGACQITEMAAPDSSITAAYSANNGCGYLFVMPGNSGTIICGMNAFGETCFFDLEGNDVTADYSDKAEVIKAAVPSISAANAESDTAIVERAFDEGAVISSAPIETTGTFGCVTSAFSVETADGIRYVFIAQPLGYGNEAMKILYVINENGEIVLFKSLSEMILHSEYYSDYTLDESAYKSGFVGTSENTYSEDMTLISGATMTSNAVHQAITDSFAAFNKVKEASAQ